MRRILRVRNPLTHRPCGGRDVQPAPRGGQTWPGSVGGEAGSTGSTGVGSSGSAGAGSSGVGATGGATGGVPAGSPVNGSSSGGVAPETWSVGSWGSS